jgi:hypothetical protein
MLTTTPGQHLRLDWRGVRPFFALNALQASEYVQPDQLYLPEGY